jgi:plasmid stabilization system protein ParE
MAAPESLKVVYSDIAHQQIFAAMIYIARQGYPDTALRFADALYEFGQSLRYFPEKYAICKRKPFAAKQLRCAPLEHYVFLYRVESRRIIVHAVIHSSRIK